MSEGGTGTGARKEAGCRELPTARTGWGNGGRPAGKQEQSRASIGMAAPLTSAPQASIDPSPQLLAPTPATLLLDLSCLPHLVQFQR